MDVLCSVPVKVLAMPSVYKGFTRRTNEAPPQTDEL